MWRVVELLARGLDAVEREAVLGDLQEAGGGSWPALLGVLGLVVRRQLQAWKGWGPSAASVAIALPMAFLLADFVLVMARTWDLYAWIVRNYGVMDLETLEETGYTLRRGLLVCSTYVLLLSIWAWTGGLVMALLSGRAFWWNALFVCGVWCVHGRMLEPHFGMALAWICFLLGARQGVQRGGVSFGGGLVLSVVTFALGVIAIVTSGLWHAGYDGFRRMAVAGVLSWPVFYLAWVGWPRMRAD